MVVHVLRTSWLLISRVVVDIADLMHVRITGGILKYGLQPSKDFQLYLKFVVWGFFSPITVIFVVVPEVVTGTKLSSIVTKLALKEMKMS